MASVIQISRQLFNALVGPLENTLQIFVRRSLSLEVLPHISHLRKPAKLELFKFCEQLLIATPLIGGNALFALSKFLCKFVCNDPLDVLWACLPLLLGELLSLKLLDSKELSLVLLLLQPLLVLLRANALLFPLPLALDLPFLNLLLASQQPLLLQLLATFAL